MILNIYQKLTRKIFIYSFITSRLIQVYFVNFNRLKFSLKKSANKMIIGFFVPCNNTAQVFILDSVRTNNMPNLNNLLNTEREKRYSSNLFLY